MKSVLWNLVFSGANLWAYSLDGNALAPANMFMAGMCSACVVISYVLKVKNERA